MNTLSTVDVLVAARALIEDPERWGATTLVDQSGRMCVLGAVSAALYGQPRLSGTDDTYERLDAEPATHALARLAGDVSPDAFRPFVTAVYSFNDDHTHAEVLALLDTAIADAHAREAEFTVEPTTVPA